MPQKPREIWEKGSKIGEVSNGARTDSQNVAGDFGDTKAELIERLSEGGLIAYGFPVRPRSARTPRRIDPIFWMYAKVDWQADVASDTMAEFHRIRFVDPLDFPDVDFFPKIGRSSQKFLILTHCHKLSREYPEFFEFSNKEKIEAIRQRIRRENPDIDVYGPNFGDSAIEKHIRELSMEYYKFLNSL